MNDEPPELRHVSYDLLFVEKQVSFNAAQFFHEHLDI